MAVAAAIFALAIMAAMVAGSSCLMDFSSASGTAKEASSSA